MSLPVAAGKSARRMALIEANLGVLRQKLDLTTVLKRTWGQEANARWGQICPVVGASVGQHFRHSTDHMELVVKTIQKENKYTRNEIHYDVRVRGGPDETDIDAAEERILRMKRALIASDNEEANGEEKDTVLACFMLSGDPTDDEFMLSSTIERELGFVAHHSIHHLAMIKVIATHTLKLLPLCDLPVDFGKAPSTIVYDNSKEQ